MPTPDTAAPSVVFELLARLREIAPLIRANAAEADRLARLPRPCADALVRNGLFRIWIPKRADGWELSLPDALRVYTAAARIDGSAGWAVMIGSGGGLFAAYLDHETAKTLYARPDALIAGSGAPDGHAERVPGGYRASGSWHYASGAHYATTFTANCLITESGRAVNDQDGKPLVRAMAFDASDVTVTPVWNTTGMRGTGSDDFGARDVFVPETRTFSVFNDTLQDAGVVYRLPFGVLTELPVASVALGVAQHVVETFATLAVRKKPHGAGYSLASDPWVQGRFAQAHAVCVHAEAGLMKLAEAAWEAALANRPLSQPELAQITAGCALAVARLRDAVDELIAVSGMNGVQIEDELARAWRDLQTVAAHGSVSPRRLTEAGKALLAADADA
ncbi:MAG TPA: acyl-CoA dehydrogenase family protein [Steroidobacteraceae bacterium]|jgi:alkylation response protein AidB-like acyl-CoA dehydrogenase